MRPSHANDRESTGARDDDGNDVAPPSYDGNISAKGSASPSMTAINTAVTASKATKDARDKGKEIITEFALPEVDRKSERSGAENKDPATKRKRGKTLSRRRTPPLSERPKTLSGTIREIRATVVNPAIEKVEFYRRKIYGVADEGEGGDTNEP